MRYCILGPVEIASDDGRPLAVAGVQERRLLVALLIAGGQTVTSEQLIAALWGAATPGNPRNALQVRVSRLRKAFPHPDVIVTASGGYRLDAAAAEVDARRFEQLVAEGRHIRARHPSDAISRYEEALRLWRGPALADFATEDFARPEATRLEELRLAANEERIDLLLQRGGHSDVIGELEALVAEHPFREHAWAQLMLALYRSRRQADALSAFRTARDLLRDELGLEPSTELGDLHRQILTHDPSLDPMAVAPVSGSGPAPIRRAPAPRHNLPARATSLVGRESDIGAVGGRLRRHRLVTIVGPGGVGKTSLAIAAAGAELDRHPDGVWLVELAPLTNPTLLPAELARVLDLRISGRATRDVLVDVLRDRTLLLVLDNCEHLIEDCARLTVMLLEHAPEVQVLATSREPLKVPGEALYAAAPLASPDDDVEPAVVMASPSVRLFVERARAVGPAFELDGDAVSAVAQICRRLDGLPLAIELAAARTRSMPAQEIARRLGRRLELLTSGARVAHPRQRTLAATLDWSYDLLTPDERVVFERFAVFSGDCSLDAAEAVVGDGVAALDRLADLVDRSLITVAHRDGQARYEMLETVREYALGRLDASGRLRDMALRHAAWHRGLVEQAELQGPDLRHWLEVFAGEVGNLRAAVQHAIRFGDDGTALRLCAAMGWFWFHGNRNEGRRTLDRVLDLPESPVGAARVDALIARATLDMFGSTPAALAAAREAEQAAGALGDRRRRAMAGALAAVEGVYGPHTHESLLRLDAAERAFEQEADDWGRGFCLFQRMEVLIHRGDLRDAIEAGQRGLAWFRRSGDPWAVSAALSHLARLARFTGRIAWGRSLAAEALDIARRHQLVHTIQFVLTQQGYLAFLAGDHDTAEQLFAEALERAATVGNRVGLADIANGRGESALDVGAVPRARDLHLSALREYTELHLDTGIAASLSRLGLAEECAGNVADAERHHADAVNAAARAGDAISLIPGIEGFGRVLAARGEAAGATELLDHADALRRRTGLWTPPAEQRALLAARSALEGAVGDARRPADVRPEDLDPSSALRRVRAVLGGSNEPTA